MGRRWQHVLVAGAAASTGALVSGCAQSGGAAGDHGPGGAVVTGVVDGDTIEVEIGGRSETVRLIGIDTPETKHPTKPIECFGPEASDYTSSLLPDGTVVRLERDIVPRDDFGRLLAYAFRVDDGLFVNESVVRHGFGDVLFIEPNGAYESRIRQALRAAREQRLGMWTRCIGGNAANE